MTIGENFVACPYLSDCIHKHMLMFNPYPLFESHAQRLAGSTREFDESTIGPQTSLPGFFSPLFWPQPK